MRRVQIVTMPSKVQTSQAEAHWISRACLGIWLALSFLFLLVAPAARAAQDVGGLAINYFPPFTADAATANSWLSQIPVDVRPLILSMDVYVAPPSNGLGEIRLMRVRYVSSLDASIDGSASEAAKRIAALDGISNFKQQITPLKVSGTDARQVSISADRFGGKLGGEFLIIYDRRANVLWQMQVIFAKRKGLNPFASINIDDDRQYAKSLLSTVTVLP